MYDRSLIAAFVGNVVGALLVAVPYTYFYLSDYIPAGHLRAVEEGEGVDRSGVRLREVNTESVSEDNLGKRD